MLKSKYLLMFILVSILTSLLDKFEGKEKKLTKRLLNQALIHMDKVRRTLAKGLDETDNTESFHIIVMGVAKTLNTAVESMNENKFDEFLNHIEKWKN